MTTGLVAVGVVNPSSNEALDAATRLLDAMDQQHLKRLMLRLGERIGAEVTLDGQSIVQGMAALKIMRSITRPGWGLHADPATVIPGALVREEAVKS
ncbi:hypothetical protein [Kitasatospora sp. NPDC092286]|uniref:hypothetical protein n=1 Tax=Kitasatospora sp. NPDC092286 TaxID=3364087 RepID=UPI00380BAB64